MSGILLVDDSQMARNLLKLILENKGYTVCGEAANGREGLEKYRQTKPDLVFCDIMMHEVDGLVCMRDILKEDPDAKVVICTSAGDELHIGEALEAGAKEFIVKPVKASEVFRITEMLIGKPKKSKKKSYRELIEKRAAKAGVDGKPLLDFYEAFYKFCGIRFDDPKVDKDYLEENTARVAIGVRALISAKMSSEQADRIVEVFRNLLS